MGVVSDAIDSLEEWCVNLMKDGIKSQFDDISSMLTNTFTKTTGGGGLINTFLAKHPADFTGSASGGSSIWNTIETLCNNVVVPIGGFILVVILLSDLIKTVINGNNFKDFDDSIFIKWVIKALCGVILVSNTYYIASALFSFGTDACAKGITTLFGSDTYLSDRLELKETALSGLNLGELMSIWFISLIVHLGIIIMLVAIVIVLASRIIEVFMFSRNISCSYGNYDGFGRMVHNRQELGKTITGIIISGIFYCNSSWNIQDAVYKYDINNQYRF